MKGIWITWENQRRNKGISSALGWPLFEIVHPGYEINRVGNRFRRYFYTLCKTIAIIFIQKPQVVAAQNPSMILATSVILLKYFIRYKVIIDSHNSGIYPMEGVSSSLMHLSRWIQRHADLTIVTNEQLKYLVESNGGRSFVLPDRLPIVPRVNKYPVEGKINIAFICSFSADEPYKEVIKAARIIPEDIIIYVTGKYKEKINEVEIPNNIKLLGYITEYDFWSLLSSVDFIMDLTLREGCLVCGAYEGVSLIKPLILSDTKILKEYFSRGCEYVEPKSMAIASGIQAAIEKHELLLHEMNDLHIIISKNWDKIFKKFKDAINSLT